MDLKGREIFAVGKWNGMEFSEDDLDDIVDNFQSLGKIHKVPLKFGHNTDQKITDGQPAIGWVKNVYREGKKLLADFVDMPKVVIDAVKKKLYRTVSVELLFNVDNGGKKFNHVLDAVALLGADQPAVNSLADLNELLATRTSFEGGHRVFFETVNGNNANIETHIDDEDYEMDKKEVNELIASALKPLETANDDLRKENEDLKKQVNQNASDKADFERQQRKDKVDAARTEIKSILDDAVKSNSMTPALRESYSRQIGLDDDDRVLDIKIEDVKLMCGATKKTDTGNDTGRDNGEEDLKDPGEKLLRLTREHQAKHNEKNFNVAFSFVTGANPELHKAYLDSNGEV
jgi:hypothetical protein